MIVIEKYEAMIEAIASYVDAEIKEHTHSKLNIDDDDLYLMNGADLKKFLAGEDIMTASVFMGEEDE